MKFMKIAVLFLLLSFLSCAGSPEPSTSTFEPPPDPGLDMYRNAFFTPDWRLIPQNQISWETAVHIPSVGISYDPQGRIIEAAGFWRGRRSDNVPVAGFTSHLKFSYDEDYESISFHYSDGSSFSLQGICSYRIQRQPETSSSILEFLEEDQQQISLYGVVWSIHFSPDSGGWFNRMMCDSTGIPIVSTEMAHNRYWFDANGNVTAIEAMNINGSRLPLQEGVFRIEMSCDPQGNITERVRFDENGFPVSDPSNPGWQLYDIAEDGLTLGYKVLDSNGEPTTDFTGIHRGEFEYDEYGRMTSSMSYDLAGSRHVTNGIWAHTIEYNDPDLAVISRRIDASGVPVELMGISETVSGFDSLGNLVSISYYNNAGEPARDDLNVHSYRFLFGEHCQMLEKQVWETSGEPGISSGGYHIERYTYSNDGSLSGIEHFDEHGEPQESSVTHL